MNANDLSTISRAPVKYGPAVPGANTGLDQKTQGSTKFAIKLLALYVFLIVSRVLDLSPIWWMRIPLILLILLIVFAFARGEIRFAFASKITRCFGAFTLWVVVCFPFSVWRGASKDSVVLTVETFVFFLIVVQLVRTIEDWRKIAGAYAYAVLIAAIYGFYAARTMEGRLSLIGGTFADPNEFALVLLVGLPFWWLKANRATALRKVLLLAGTVPIYMTVARTGSRTGLLAFGVMVLVTFVFAKAPQKLLISIVALVGIAIASVSLPAYLKARYVSLLSAHGTEDLDAKSREQLLGADLGSSDQRQALLRQSIVMTFEHPIFGVGPGVFCFAAWDERKAAEGSAGNALATHNTYTQVSSETGFPGFIFFALATFLSIRYALADYRITLHTDQDLAKCARYLLISWFALAVGIFFLSVGYTHMLAMFFAMAASLHNIISGRQTTQPVPADRSANLSSPLREPRKILREPRRIPKALQSGWSGKRSRGLVSPPVRPDRNNAV